MHTGITVWFTEHISGKLRNQLTNLKPYFLDWILQVGIPVIMIWSAIPSQTCTHFVINTRRVFSVSWLKKNVLASFIYCNY